ncbi:MAG: hypothetical protein IT529_17065 [Burkholderiales bacterium]|nr:hypothetical protein [Burkholderiales bacterium]
MNRVSGLAEVPDRAAAGVIPWRGPGTGPGAGNERRRAFRRRPVIAAGLSVLLAGCGVSSVFIKSEAINFGGVIEDTTNKLLVMNLLRARDKAPLHFSDIPVVRESIQQNVSVSLLQFLGGRLPATTTDTLAAGAGVQVSPSFEINHLHSKDFITGISSPIDPRVVKYALDRGIDRRIALLLFFSAVEIIETRSEKGPVSTIRIANAPREAIEVIKRRTAAFTGTEELRCDSQSDFERYLKLFNTLRTFFATSYRERRLLARDLRPGDPNDSRNLQAFAALDQSRVQLQYDRERGTYSLFSLSNEQKVSFCFYDDEHALGGAVPQYEAIESGSAGAGRRSCSQSIVDVGVEAAPGRGIASTPIFFRGEAALDRPSAYCGIFNRFVGLGPAVKPGPGGYPRLELKLYLRSVAEIFQFLGDLLYYQEEVRGFVDANPLLALKLNSPVTFGYCGDRDEPGCDDIFLRLDGDPCNARFSLNYRGRDYHVSNFDPPGGAAGRGENCRPEPAARRDHTLEILAVLHQLVGLNKSASDIRGTPAVQVLP